MSSDWVQYPKMEFSSLFDEFPKNYGFQEILRGGSGSSSSSLVLDGERGELVKAVVRPGQKGAKPEKALVALRNHCEAERRRRERINGHLATLRSLIPGTSKMDKASLLGEVINHLKEMRSNAAEATKGILVPLDVDEVRVEQEDGLSDDGVSSCSIRVSLCCEYKQEILSDLRQALDALQLKQVGTEIATLGDRMVYVFLITCDREKHVEGGQQGCPVLASSVRHALRSVLDKFNASEEISLRNTLSNKRRRGGPFVDSSNSSSLGDFW